MIAYYGEDWFHERAFLGWASQDSVFTVSPVWEIFCEQLNRFNEIIWLGYGNPRPANERARSITMFDEVELKDKLPELEQRIERQGMSLTMSRPGSSTAASGSSSGNKQTYISIDDDGDPIDEIVDTPSSKRPRH